MKIKLNRKALGDLALRGDKVRAVIEAEGAKRQARLTSDLGAENVDGGMGGKRRARYTIRRLDPLTEETKDGKLSRLLGGGG